MLDHISNTKFDLEEAKTSIFLQLQDQNINVHLNLALIESINKNNELEDKVEFNYLMYKTNNLWRGALCYAGYLIKDLEKSKTHGYNSLSLD